MTNPRENKKLILQGRDMVEELGLENLAKEKQGKILEELGKVLYDRMLLRLIEKLSDEEAEKVNILLNKGEIEKAYEYIERKVPNFPAILKKEIKAFQEAVIQRAKTFSR